MTEPCATGVLDPGEPHPAARQALSWITQHEMAELAMWLEAFSSCAIEGNRLGAVCVETLRRILSGEPVSDRYVLGLAWAIRMGLAEKGDDPKAP